VYRLVNIHEHYRLTFMGQYSANAFGLDNYGLGVEFALREIFYGQGCVSFLRMAFSVMRPHLQPIQVWRRVCQSIFLSKKISLLHL
jgi:hypothetical protein